jgi:MFS family permease
MWRNRSLVAGVTLMFGATGILVGTFFLNTLYLQHELGFSALETGFAFLPISVLIGFGAHSAQHLMGRIGTRAVAVVGLALIAVGALILAAAPDHARYATELLPGFLVLALGIGLVFPTASVTTMNDVDHRRAGLASGLMTTGHEIGAALGVATFSAIATAGDTFSVGYGNGFVIAAIVSAVMALVALVTVPAVRPAGGASVPVH